MVCVCRVSIVLLCLCTLQLKEKLKKNEVECKFFASVSVQTRQVASGREMMARATQSTRSKPRPPQMQQFLSVQVVCSSIFSCHLERENNYHSEGKKADAFLSWSRFGKCPPLTNYH